MEINGEYRLHASREQVWKMLNDPEILRQCIPGCESLEPVADNELTAKVTAAIGPVKSKFDTRVKLENLNPPESYTITGEAKSGVAGFGRGAANVVLSEDGDVTVLRYDADLKVGGKLAQIGSRMVVGATRKTADDFFDAFARLVDPEADESRGGACGTGLRLRLAHLAGRRGGSRRSDTLVVVVLAAHRSRAGPQLEERK